MGKSDSDNSMDKKNKVKLPNEQEKFKKTNLPKEDYKKDGEILRKKSTSQLIMDLKTGKYE